MLEPLLRSARRKPLQAARLHNMAARRRLPHASRPPTNLRLPAAPVHIVAPEECLRAAIAHTLRPLGVRVRLFDRAAAFAEALPELEPGWLLVDAAVLASAGDPSRWPRPGWPTILMFDALDTEDAVRAIRLGASDLLRKPVSQDELLEALRRVAPKLEEHRLHEASLGAQRAVESLTEREREVLAALKEGLCSKKIARALGISHRTVEMYRNKIRQKLGVTSMAQMLRIALLADGLGERSA